ESPDRAVEHVASARTADACDVSVPIRQADAALIDARVLADDLAEALHPEFFTFGPVDRPARQILAQRCFLRHRTMRRRKRGGFLLADIDEDPWAFVERVHRMPRHACFARVP